jgi:hypothetical protein
MLDAAQFLCRLGALDGELPQYGDWDEGRVLASSGDRSDVGGSVRLALSLAGTGAAAGWRSAYDECAWHARAGEPVVADPARVRGQTAGAHFGRAQVGPFTVWLKLGASPSHGHADLGHVSVRRNDLWIVGDPGTGTYNGDPAVRDYFRSGRAHNVLRCADRDLILAHRAFRWASKATGVLGPPIRVGEAVVMWGVHDAYAGHEHGGHVARAVVVDAHSIGVIDWTERPMPAWARSVPLAPSLSATAGGGDVAITGADTPDLRLAVAGGVTAVRRGGIEPYAGWWSRTYGETEPAAVVETTGQDAVVLAWMLYDGSAPTVAVSAPATARIGAFELSMSWQAREAELLVRSGANEESVRVDLPAVAAPARGRR